MKQTTRPKMNHSTQFAAQVLGPILCTRQLLDGSLELPLHSASGVRGQDFKSLYMCVGVCVKVLEIILPRMYNTDPSESIYNEPAHADGVEGRVFAELGTRGVCVIRDIKYTPHGPHPLRFSMTLAIAMAYLLSI